MKHIELMIHVSGATPSRVDATIVDGDDTIPNLKTIEHTRVGMRVPRGLREDTERLPALVDTQEIRVGDVVLVDYATRIAARELLGESTFDIEDELVQYVRMKYGEES